MAYPIMHDANSKQVQLELDLIDLLVAVTEITDKHKTLPDSSEVKTIYLQMANHLNETINGLMHEAGLHDLFQVRSMMELSVRNIIKSKGIASKTLQKLIDERI